MVQDRQNFTIRLLHKKISQSLRVSPGDSWKSGQLKSLKRTISTGENVTGQNTFDKYFGNRAYGDGTRGKAKGPGSAHS